MTEPPLHITLKDGREYFCDDEASAELIKQAIKEAREDATLEMRQRLFVLNEELEALRIEFRKFQLIKDERDEALLRIEELEARLEE